MNEQQELEALRNGSAQLVQQIGDFTAQRDRAVELERHWNALALKWQARAVLAERYIWISVLDALPPTHVDVRVYDTNWGCVV